MASRNHSVSFKGIFNPEEMSIIELIKEKGQIVGEKKFYLEKELAVFNECEVKLTIVEQVELEPDENVDEDLGE